MYKQIGAALEDTRQVTISVSFAPGAWSADAITERDRRDFEASLKAQAERLKRNTDARRN